jgi:hypothetical protein
MKKDGDRFSLTRPAIYQIEVTGHLDAKKATWFEDLALSTGYDESGGPVTIMKGKIIDQAMLHSLLTRIRDLGLPLISVRCLNIDDNG